MVVRGCYLEQSTNFKIYDRLGNYKVKYTEKMPNANYACILFWSRGTLLLDREFSNELLNLVYSRETPISVHI